MDLLAGLNAIGRGEGAGAASSLPEEVEGWRPEAVAVPRAKGLHGFALSNTPKVLGDWIAQGKVWATPDAVDVAGVTKINSIAGRMRAILASTKYTAVVKDTWEALMTLYREGSTFSPAAWAWWRLTEAPRMPAYGVFSPAVLALPWQRKKFWEAVGTTFNGHNTIFPAATAVLARTKRAARTAGDVDMLRWNNLIQTEREQRGKIKLAIEGAWERHNLSLWLADNDNRLSALRIKGIATCEVG